MDGRTYGGNNGSMSDMAGGLDRSRGRPERSGMMGKIRRFASNRIPGFFPI